MSDSSKQHRSLSDISHLFLSSVRERQTNGAPRPQRTPPAPQPPLAATDLTADQLREVLCPEPAAAETPARIPPVKALICSHLGPQQLQAARRYARTLAEAGKRVGLIVMDVSEFRLFTFEQGPGLDSTDECRESGCFDPRAMRDAVNELNWDLDCWLLAIANLRLPEARDLMRRAGRWTVLSSADHDGIVAAYRLLKGLADLRAAPPKLSLAVLDAPSAAESERVFRKLSGVCEQFLAWPMEHEPAVGDVAPMIECQVICCRATHDKAQLAAAPHWRVVAELLEQSRHAAAELALAEGPEAPEPQPTPAPPQEALRIDPAPPQAMPAPAPAPPGPAPAAPPAIALQPSPALAEVIELPEQTDPVALLNAILRHSMNDLVECPLRPPMCPEAILAVSRDRRLTLVALAGPGLCQLQAIGQAYRWVSENRALLAMALPQFALDSHLLPHVRLLIEQADLDAQLLQPILQAGTVSLHTYRRLRWGQRTGLLLEAA